VEGPVMGHAPWRPPALCERFFFGDHLMRKSGGRSTRAEREVASKR
jgi:hypothetical protein